MSHIYVIGPAAPAPGPVKIGLSADVERRLHELRTDTTRVPDSVDRAALTLLYVHEGDRQLERALHLHLCRLRVLGEWYRLDPAVARREVRMAIREVARTPMALRTYAGAH
jgi:hypothetical protein